MPYHCQILIDGRWVEAQAEERFAIEEFTELKTLQMQLGPRTNWWHRAVLTD